MQTSKSRRRISAGLAALAIAATFIVPVLAKTSTKPTAVIIKAEWCSACQKLELTMAELMKQYAGRMNFVVLDVTTEETAKESAAAARRLGISRFFQENQQNTSTVAVFGKGNRLLFQTAANFDRDNYVRAFDEAIAKAGK